MKREKAFEEVQGMSMVDPSILDTAAYCVIDDCLKETSPEYFCDTSFQWCYESKLKTLKYDQEIPDRCYKENHRYIQKI